jgi:hypothetical protein
MTRLVRRVVRLAQDRLEQTDPVERLSQEELLARADRVARRLGVSRQEAFAMLARGELDGTRAGVELHTVRTLLNGASERALSA